MTYKSKSQAKCIEVMKNAEQSDYENLSRKLEDLSPPYPCETIQAIEKEIGDVRL